MTTLEDLDLTEYDGAYIRFHGKDQDITDDSWMSGHMCAMCDVDNDQCDDLCPARGRIECSHRSNDWPILGIKGAVCAFEILDGEIIGDSHDYEHHEDFTIFEGIEISSSEFEVPEGVYVIPKKVLRSK